jgi:hypothetical protein
MLLTTGDNRMLTKQEAMEAIKKAVDMGHGDPETSHSIADDALCGFLEGLGHHDLVEEWHKVAKWYA